VSRHGRLRSGVEDVDDLERRAQCMREPSRGVDGPPRRWCVLEGADDRLTVHLAHAIPTDTAACRGADPLATHGSTADG